MSALLLQQSIFVTELVPRLLSWCRATGKVVTAGELWRPPEMVAIYVQRGMGSATSLHPDRLAIDLNLIVDGELATTVEAYRPMGEYWKQLHRLARWGGDFKNRPDADHFSMEWMERR